MFILLMNNFISFVSSALLPFFLLYPSGYIYLCMWPYFASFSVNKVGYHLFFALDPFSLFCLWWWYPLPSNNSCSVFYIPSLSRWKTCHATIWKNDKCVCVYSIWKEQRILGFFFSCFFFLVRNVRTRIRNGSVFFPIRKRGVNYFFSFLTFTVLLLSIL